MFLKPNASKIKKEMSKQMLGPRCCFLVGKVVHFGSLLRHYFPNVFLQHSHHWAAGEVAPSI